MGEPNSTADHDQPAGDRPTVGRRLGEFVVREPIGAGGYGQVYLAEQPLLDRQAVIKVLHHRHGTETGVIRRFLREARLASRLDHPYAAHIYSFGAEPDGLLWIAMELVRGMTLSELIAERGALPLERFVPLLERLCEVVQTAHEQGIIHRDLKPGNVMVISRAGRLLPKLLDLGIARDLSPAVESSDGDSDVSHERSRSRSGRGLLGSPHYMAPEQWYAPATVDQRTDIYALGVLSFEVLTGRPPFTGLVEDILAEKQKVDPPRVVDLAPQADPRLASLADALLARD
ncbi:MAG: serine/threonine-protein kinase, partial [Myxococcota bacterium]